MAIRSSHTRIKTGATFPTAHHVLQPPVFQPDARQVTLKVLIYASKADYDAGKDPVGEFTRQFEQAVFNALMQDIRDRVEPAMIQRFFPSGVRVPD